VLRNNPIPGGAGGGEGNLNLDLPFIGVGPIGELGSSVGSFEKVIDAVGDEVPFGFVQGFEFEPTVFTPPRGGTGTTGSAAPEPSTWAMLIAGFAAMAWMGYRRAWKVAPRAPLSAA
jgi:hypothetical protein